MLYMVFSKQGRMQAAASVSASESNSDGAVTGNSSGADFEEDEVDKILRGEDGKIYRKRNEQLYVNIYL